MVDVIFRPEVGAFDVTNEAFGYIKLSSQFSLGNIQLDPFFSDLVNDILLNWTG